jgi:hypothetical protein
MKRPALAVITILLVCIAAQALPPIKVQALHWYLLAALILACVAMRLQPRS